MAAATDKARFYLEQQVPELREWERREIFSTAEIAAIAAKRSDFEHILNARGSTPADYARYAEYEMNLDGLRRKRVQRKGVKTTAYTGQKHIFSILDRSTRKFHGDLGLWMQYLEYARSQRANKKLNKLLTEVLRMHPTKAEVWIYAARYAVDVQADVPAARNYMQRGLRFCSKSRAMYLEYARLEMGYVAKINARRAILGIEPEKNNTTKAVHEEAVEEIQNEDREADMITLPMLSAEDLAPQTEDDDEDIRMTNLSANDPALTPAMTGAIPLAIFDAAMKKFASPPNLAEKFFDTFAIFSRVSFLSGMLEHVVDKMLEVAPSSPSTLSCSSRMPLIGLTTDDPAFPMALGKVLKEIRSSLEKTSDRPMLAQKLLNWLLPMSAEQSLGPELKKVISATLKVLKREINDTAGT